MTNNFSDRYLHTVDSKGRLQLSRAVRDRFKLKKGEKLHLLPNIDNPPFLEIRNQAQWDAYQKRFLDQAPSELKRDFVRFVELSKETVPADAQGRISIPKRLRDQCALDGSVTVINLTTCVEVWNTEYVERKYSDMAKAFKDINNTFF